MPESEIIPQETKARIEQIGQADLVLGLDGANSAGALEAAVAKAQEAMQMLAPNLSAVLVHSDGSPQAAQMHQLDGNLRLLQLPRAPESESLLPASRPLSQGRRALLTVSRLLEAKACSVIETDLENITAENMRRLLDPILGRDQDLVVAFYQRRKFDSLINTAIVYPLLRALYGKRVRWPMARDFSLSRRLVERYLASPATTAGQFVEVSPAWIVTEAVRGGFQVCQAHLPARLESAQPGPDLSTVLARVLGPMFLEMERDAPFWQKLRGSQPISTFGEAVPVVEESSPVDVSRMIESFQLGFRNLQEVWNVALSPGTIIGMKRMTLLAPEHFRMPDDLWVRIVYDFALAFRLRVISRDHLLRALTPVYLAWVASYALAVKDAGESGVEERIERICGVYEAEKPYFLSRWRWPDRFNP